MEKRSDSVLAKDIMGMPGIFSKYRKVFWLDLICPLIFAVLLTGTAYGMDVASTDVLTEALNIGMLIIPVLLSVLVAGYVLLLTVYFSGKIEFFRIVDEGRELLYSLNANFAFCIIGSIVALAVLIIVSFVFHLDIQSSYHKFINYSCTCTIFLLLFYLFKNLKDLVLSLFNFGQSFIFERQLPKIRDAIDNEQVEKNTQLDKA